MVKQPDELRALLSKFACQLRRLKFPTSPISAPLAKFVATAIEDYLSGDAKSLDAAFGLGKKRGRPVTKAAEHDRIAEVVFAHRMKGLTWDKIFEILYPDRADGGPDKKTIREIYKARFVSLAAAKIARDLRLTARRPAMQDKPRKPRA